MVDTTLTPADDSFAELLGTAGSVDPHSRATSVAGATPFPTRREMRAQWAAESSVSQPGNRREARAADRVAVRRRGCRLATRAAIAAPVYALPTKPARSGRFRALITIVAVGGLFTSAGLPAYALSTAGGVVSSDDTLAPVSTQSLAVSADAKLALDKRGDYTATSPADLAQQRSDFAKQANWDAYQTSGAQELGDDYPWFSELSNRQGGGLSPLNYFYRECVDFVAWRLNRDAGSTQAPFKYDWSTLTPNGGNASQWASNWAAHGWPTGTVPKVGAVAWFAGNHVSYVNTVNDDGTVLIEEYNYGSDHTYGQRTIPATDVALFLYAPPR